MKTQSSLKLCNSNKKINPAASVFHSVDDTQSDTGLLFVVHFLILRSKVLKSKKKILVFFSLIYKVLVCTFTSLNNVLVLVSRPVLDLLQKSGLGLVLLYVLFFVFLKIPKIPWTSLGLWDNNYNTRSLASRVRPPTESRKCHQA